MNDKYYKRWKSIFEKRKEFQGNNKQFCKEFNIPQCSYYKAKKAFEQDDLLIESSNEAAVSKPQHLEVQQIQVIDPKDECPLEVITVNDISIGIPNDISVDLLGKIVKVCMSL